MQNSATSRQRLRKQQENDISAIGPNALDQWLLIFLTLGTPFLILMVTDCLGERSFSRFKRIKNWLHDY